ncbi:MAG: putative toxin-antitoxin system toxin component, PIN family [Nitrospirae bacterium]|nr:putative toxin-antitoxin system toxin component, PIN family [Nitrospirota bacterium]
MKVLIDTNVLVSAILKDKDPELVFLFIAGRPDIEWIVSPDILKEYREVLSRDKFSLPEEIKTKWFNMLDILTTVIEVDLNIDFPRDIKDQKFIECAVIADANYFITGDKDFSQAQKLLNTTIISVTKFKEMVCDKPD